ncbi:MAG TPA: 4a-hydroxytetrahydrobiopterin dehydratase [Gemmatimonadaceae bacterium]|nr:4a-hydroxytetrahydrobiopterin dehydratase [Gemmatimonadaceae bacterium]
MAERTLTDQEASRALGDLTSWRAEGGTIRRTYETEGWGTTLMLVNAIGFVAEAADHHPDLEVSWAKVAVRLSTHSAGGITDKDIALAREIERLALWRPEGGGPLRGTKRAFVKRDAAR